MNLSKWKGRQSKAIRGLKIAGVASAALGGIVLGGMLTSAPRLQAHDNGEESIIQRGFEIAPVPLNLAGKDRNLVGLGSYIVNAVSDCNSCHTGGQFPSFDYTVSGNPYFGEPPVVDPTVYLAGGQSFGPVGDPVGPSGYAGPDIVSRNLTPDKTGRPEGGHTLAQFKQILRTGIDFDHSHPTCTSLTPTPQPANCIPSTLDNPIDGSVLQLMPWPTFRNMADHDMDAIYEYLSAVPCIEGPPAPSILHNDCK